MKIHDGEYPEFLCCPRARGTGYSKASNQSCPRERHVHNNHALLKYLISLYSSPSVRYA
jgi:hypothetical protein